MSNKNFEIRLKNITHLSRNWSQSQVDGNRSISNLKEKKKFKRSNINYPSPEKLRMGLAKPQILNWISPSIRPKKKGAGPHLNPQLDITFD